MSKSLLKTGLLFLITSILTSGLNYLYHLFMGRLLGPSEYGVLGSLFAILYIVQFSSPTIQYTISKYTSELLGKKKKKDIAYLISKAISKILFIGVISLLLYTLISPLIADFLNLNSSTGVVLIGIIGLLTLVSSVIIGGLNGLQKFGWQNTISVIGTTLKLGLAILLVYLGFGVNGALFALLLAVLFSILFGFIPLFNFIKLRVSKNFKTSKIYSYLFYAFLASVTPTMIISIDHLLVKHLFSSADAGLYTAAGMIGKIIWFGSGFLVSVLFPKVSQLKAEGKNVTTVLRNCLIYTSIMVFLGCLVFFTAPSFIVNTLYGAEYLSISSLIGLLGLSMGFFSLSQVLISYNLAIEKFKFLYIISILLFLEFFAIYFISTSINEIVKIMLVINTLMFLGLVVFNIKDLGFYEKS